MANVLLLIYYFWGTWMVVFSATSFIYIFKYQRRLIIRILISQGDPHGCKSFGFSFVCCSMIMSLSNALMYEGRLECGSERTAIAQLQLPCWDVLEKELCVCQPQYTAWVQAALDPQKSVCFLDTSQVCLTSSIVVLLTSCYFRQAGKIS